MWDIRIKAYLVYESIKKEAVITPLLDISILFIRGLFNANPLSKIGNQTIFRFNITRYI